MSCIKCKDLLPGALVKVKNEWDGAHCFDCGALIKNYYKIRKGRKDKFRGYNNGYQKK